MVEENFSSVVSVYLNDDNVILKRMTHTTI